MVIGQEKIPFRTYREKKAPSRKGTKHLFRGTTLIPAVWQALDMRNVHRRHLLPGSAIHSETKLRCEFRIVCLNRRTLPAADVLSLPENRILLCTITAFLIFSY